MHRTRWQQAGGKLDSVFAFAGSAEGRRGLWDGAVKEAAGSAAAGAAARQRLQGQPTQMLTTRTMTRVLAVELGNF